MLKKAKNEYKVLFLQSFIEEIIINKKKQLEKEQPEEKKFEEIHIPDFKQPPKLEEAKFMPSIYSSEKTESGEIKKPASMSQYQIPQQRIQKPNLFLKKYPSSNLKHKIGKFNYPLKKQQISQRQVARADIDLGKLNFILSDREIVSAECAGPNKPITIRKAGKTFTTKVSLSKEEIQKLINKFSEKARIPVLGGIFKASVGNLILSAVISEFVGTRFIINKETPYSLIEPKRENPPQRKY